MIYDTPVDVLKYIPKEKDKFNIIINLLMGSNAISKYHGNFR